MVQDQLRTLNSVGAGKLLADSFHFVYIKLSVCEPSQVIVDPGVVSPGDQASDLRLVSVLSLDELFGLPQAFQGCLMLASAPRQASASAQSLLRALWPSLQLAAPSPNALLGKGLILPSGGNHVVFLELRRGILQARTLEWVDISFSNA